MKRRTVVENLQYNGDASRNELEQLDTNPSSPPASPQRRRSRRIRDSVVSLSAVNDVPTSFDRSPPVLELPETQERPPKQHRFSLMKFRHASDSQLSKTAKDHEQAPPLPCKFILKIDRAIV